MRVSLVSPAKINLGLSIVGRREDGFHQLESLFWPLTFGDEINIAQGPGKVCLEWAPTAPFPNSPLPSAKENLVTKVLALLPKKPDPSIDIWIKKNIPIGGGLGGGSSNAGTLLCYLRDTQSLKMPSWEEWSSRLGADVPFFLDARPTWVTGIGEKLKPLELEPGLVQKLYFLIIVFPFGCDTKEIFSNYKQSGMPYSEKNASFNNLSQLNFQHLRAYLSEAVNDLEPVARAHRPGIGKVLDKLRSQTCLYASLSGSGATCFALFDSIDAREETSKDLREFFREVGCKSIKAETFTTH